MPIVLLHPGGEVSAIHLEGCEQILLETVVLHSAPGAAVLLSGCRDITLDTVQVMPHPGSGHWISCVGGGVEILDCTGTVGAQHAVLNATAGAGMRVQQAYWRLTTTSDPQVAMAISADGRPLPEWLLPKQGAYLQLSEAGTLKLLGEIAVTKAEPAPGGMKLTFAETLSPAVSTGTLICLSATNQPQLKLDDCKFLGGPHAGLVAQSRARVGNTSFIGYAGPAVLLAPDTAHLRGPVVENIHITDCSFEQCNIGSSGPRGGAITIGTQPPGEGAAASSTHRINEGITVQRNTFRRLGGPAIDCSSASWVDIESNHFNDCDMLRSTGAEPRAMVFHNLDESTITLNDAKSPAIIVMTACTDKVKVGDNGLLTMASH
jgi:hypothetical protein